MSGRTRRAVDGLRWARVADAPPFMAAPKKLRKQSQQAGLVYEAKVAEYLRLRYGEERIIHGPWLEYQDEWGHGWAQPDILILPDGAEKPLVICECKLTFTKRAAESKLRSTYLPLVREVYPGLDYRTVQACKNLSRSAIGQRTVITNIGDVYHAPHKEGYLVWNWIPRAL